MPGKALLLLLPALLSGAEAGAIRVVQTARDSPDRLEPKPALDFGGDFTGYDFTVQVSHQAKAQTILGFGGAFTDAAAVNFAALTPAQQDQLVEAYWGTDGIGYTVGRVPINSCDFTVDTYSFDEVEGDYNLAHFDSNVTHDTRQMIPLIRRAMASVASSGSALPLRLYGSPWSPPSWMKIPHPGQYGHGMNGSADPLGLIQDPKVQQSWAQYYVKWIDSYAKQGIPIWGLTVQNEPQAKQPFESCLYTPEAERDFVKLYLGPTLKKAHPDVKLMVWDHNKYNCTLKPKGCPDPDHNRDMLSRTQIIMHDPEAAKYIDGVAFHWYQIFEGYDWGFDVVTASQGVAKGKFVLNTEACVCPVSPHWDHGELYGTDILGDLNAGSVGWVDWNLLLDAEGGPNHIPGHRCEAPVMRGNASDPDSPDAALRFLPQFYYMAHVSKYVLPQSRIVGTSLSPLPATRTTDKGVPVPFVATVAAERPDGNTTVVLLNNEDVPVVVRIVESGNKFVRVNLPPHAATTLVYLTPQ